MEETSARLAAWPGAGLDGRGSGPWAGRGRGRQRSEGRAGQGFQAMETQLELSWQRMPLRVRLGHVGGAPRGGGSVAVARGEEEGVWVARGAGSWRCIGWACRRWLGAVGSTSRPVCSLGNGRPVFHADLPGGVSTCEQEPAGLGREPEPLCCCQDVLRDHHDHHMAQRELQGCLWGQHQALSSQAKLQLCSRFQDHHDHLGAGTLRALGRKSQQLGLVVQWLAGHRAGHSPNCKPSPQSSPAWPPRNLTVLTPSASSTNGLSLHLGSQQVTWTPKLTLELPRGTATAWHGHGRHSWAASAPRGTRSVLRGGGCPAGVPVEGHSCSQRGGGCRPGHPRESPSPIPVSLGRGSLS